ncbi:hypothetical protein K4K53_000266 [Colletotrichum sp. SAR 10_77]|nr:hypothetical protein K4K53_000266 [Colletotrichum sp. SAR 10_77]
MANALLDLRSADTASLMNDLACDQDMMASILSTIHMPSINIEPMGFGVSEQLPSPTAGLQISAGLLRGKAQKSTENAQRANMIEQWTRQLQDRRLQLNLAGLHVEVKNIDKQMDVQRERIKTIEIDMRAQQKNISLSHLNAEAMLSIREVWKTTFSLSEMLFDLDCPGQYFRRIHCNASLVDHRYRYDPGCTGGYMERISSNKPDPWFLGQTLKLPVSSVALSRGQLDAGVFELNFDGEEYQPFEGGGSISRWELRLPETYTQFDYKTISDVIIHLRYTANNGGETLRSAVEQSLNTSIKDAAKNTHTALFDMRNDAPDDWHMLLSSQSERAVAQMRGLKSRLPYLARSQDIKVTSVKIYAGGQDLKEASISLSSTREQDFGSSAMTLKYADDLGKLETVPDTSAFDHYDQILALSQGMIDDAMANIQKNNPGIEDFDAQSAFDTYDNNPLHTPERRQYNGQMREWLQKHFQVPGDYRPEQIFAKFADAHRSQVSLVTNPLADLNSVYEQWKTSSEMNTNIGNASEKVFQIIAVQRQKEGFTTIGTRFNLDAPAGKSSP